MSTVILLSANEAARRRLAYGRDERCGEPVGDERLRALPSTRHFVDDQLAIAR